jgi:hypothetical protein
MSLSLFISHCLIRFRSSLDEDALYSLANNNEGPGARGGRRRASEDIYMMANIDSEVDDGDDYGDAAPRERGSHSSGARKIKAIKAAKGKLKRAASGVPSIAEEGLYAMGDENGLGTASKGGRTPARRDSDMYAMGDELGLAAASRGKGSAPAAVTRRDSDMYAMGDELGLAAASKGKGSAPAAAVTRRDSDMYAMGDELGLQSLAAATKTKVSVRPPTASTAHAAGASKGPLATARRESSMYAMGDELGLMSGPRASLPPQSPLEDLSLYPMAGEEEQGMDGLYPLAGGDDEEEEEEFEFAAHDENDGDDDDDDGDDGDDDHSRGRRFSTTSTARMPPGSGINLALSLAQSLELDEQDGPDRSHTIESAYSVAVNSDYEPRANDSLRAELTRLAQSMPATNAPYAIVHKKKNKTKTAPAPPPKARLSGYEWDGEGDLA